MNGIIVIDKENGYTSFDVVAKMRRICGEKNMQTSVNASENTSPASIVVLI